MIFWLKCQGKRRGWVERTENFNIDLSTLTDEQLTELANGKDLASVLRKHPAPITG